MTSSSMKMKTLTIKPLALSTKMFNLVARAHADGPESHAYKMHEIKRHDFMWLGEDGMRMCGTNGSQAWDLGFITQALVETGLAELDENRESSIKALEWFDQAQIRDNPRHHYTSTDKQRKVHGALGKSFTLITRIIDQDIC